MNDGHMDDVHRIRDRYDADLVHLITDPDDLCGIATLGPGASRAFGITDHSCILYDFSFAHELGHNMGLTMTGTQKKCSGPDGVRLSPCNAELDNTPHAYSYGYVNQAAFRAGADPDQRWMTVMAYDWQCEDNGVSAVGAAVGPPLLEAARLLEPGPTL